MPAGAPEAWDAVAAAAAQPIITWRGDVWRAHKRRFQALDAEGSRLFSARYHRAPDLFPDGNTWTALYCGLSYGVCLAEILRHVTAELLPSLKQQRLSKIAVDLSAVLDCRDVVALGVSLDTLFHDIDYSHGQALAAAAIARGCEGLLVPSATLLPDPILVIFPDHLRPEARLVLVTSVDPALYIDHTTSP